MRRRLKRGLLRRRTGVRYWRSHPSDEGRDMRIQHWVVAGAVGLAVSTAAGSAVADGNSICSGLPSQATLESALDGAVGATGNGGLGFNLRGTILPHDRTLFARPVSRGAYTTQRPSNRTRSAQKTT